MKALSIKQPWANMIANGKKTIETRKWKTSYRGPLLIVSSKLPPIKPAGFALAIARVADCRPMTKEDEVAACCPVYMGAFSWVLEDVRRIEPFPVKGGRGIYEVNVDARLSTAISQTNLPNVIESPASGTSPDARSRR